MNNYFSHPTAVIDHNNDIGHGTKIWHYSHICSGAKIGANVTIGQNVYVSSKAIIGDNCKIQNNVSIYDNVILENDVFCGPSTVFTNVKNPRAFIERKDEYLTTIVQEGATLGANSTVVCGIIIGKFSMVGAGAVVTKNVEKYELVVGNPAQKIGWITKGGEILNRSLLEGTKITCPITKEKYLIIGGNLQPI